VPAPATAALQRRDAYRSSKVGKFIRYPLGPRQELQIQADVEACTSNRKQIIYAHPIIAIIGHCPVKLD
jgi:hypothetical protein